MFFCVINKVRKRIVVLLCISLIFSDASFVFASNNAVEFEVKENEVSYNEEVKEEKNSEEPNTIIEENEEEPEVANELEEIKKPEEELKGENKLDKEEPEEAEEPEEEPQPENVNTLEEIKTPEEVNEASESEPEEINEEVNETTTEASKSEAEEVEEINEASESEIIVETLSLNRLNAAPHTHFACGCEIENLGGAGEASICSIHNVSDKITYSSIIQSNVATLLDDGAIYDYVLDEDIKIDTAYSKNSLNICLNGHALTFTKDLDFMTLSSGDKITICDCQNHSGSIGYDTTVDASDDGTTFIIEDGTMAIYESDIVASFSELTKKISLINVKETGKLHFDGVTIRDTHINKETITPTGTGAAGISPFINVESNNTDSYVYMHNIEIKDNVINNQPLISLGGKAKFLLKDINIHNNTFEKACLYVNNSVVSTISDIVFKNNDGEDLAATGYERGAYTGFLSFYGNNVQTNMVNALFDHNTSYDKACIGIYHGKLNLYDDFIAENNEMDTSGGIFMIVGASGKKNLNFYGNATINNNTAYSNAFIWQDFGGIYIGKDAVVNVTENTSTDTYMMTFVDGKSAGGGFLIDGKLTFYNNEALGTSDYGCIYLYSSALTVNGSLVIDSYTSAGYYGSIALMYNSTIKGKNKNIILRNNKGKYSGGIVVTYVTQNNWTQELSNIVFENNESTGGYGYMDNLYAYKLAPSGTTAYDFDIYIHDCEFIGSAGLYAGTSDKTFKIEKTIFKDIDKYSTSGWASAVAGVGIGMEFKLINATMSNVQASALLYADYDYSPNITISDVNIISDELKTNKFAYFFCFDDDRYSNECNVELNNLNVENTVFAMPIINKDNSAAAKFKVNAKDMTFKNTYGDWGLFYMNNFASGDAEFENILIDTYNSESNTNTCGVLNFDNSIVNLKNVNINKGNENSPKPMLWASGGSKVKILGECAMTNMEVNLPLIYVENSGTEVTVEEPLVMTGNTMKASSTYKNDYSVCLSILDGAEVKLLKGANITNNTVEDKGAVYIESASLSIAGKVNIEKSTNKKVNVYLANENSGINYINGYDKIASGSCISMTTNVDDTLAFTYWNENSIAAWNNGPHYLPDAIFKVDDNQARLGYQIYKSGTYDRIKLYIGRNYEKLIYKKEDNDEVLAIQYMEKNVLTYADRVKYEKVPLDWQKWNGPSLADDTITENWDMSSDHDVCLTGTRYVILERLPRLNIKSHLDPRFFTLKESYREVCYTKTIELIGDINYDSECYDVYGWSYSPIYESFDTKAQAMADPRYIIGTVYDKLVDSDIYPMYHQKVAFVEYKEADGSKLNMAYNSHLPNYIFINKSVAQSITAAKKPGYNFLGWTGTDITDVPVKKGNIEIYNLTSIATRSYTAYFTKIPENVSGGGSSSGGGGGGGVSNVSAAPTYSVNMKSDSFVPVLDNQVAWNYDPKTNKWSLYISTLQLNATDGFYKILSVTNQNEKNANVKESMYCFDISGNMMEGWVKTADNFWFFFDTEKENLGKKVVGTWKAIDGKWYCFGVDGKLYQNTFVGEFFVNENGELVK